MQSKQLGSQLGSAVVDFVLLLTPILVLVNIITFTIFSSMLRATTVAAASQLAQACGLADFDSDQIRALAKDTSPSWVRVLNASCDRKNPLVEVILTTSLKYPFEGAESEVVWHAAFELD